MNRNSFHSADVLTLPDDCFYFFSCTNCNPTRLEFSELIYLERPTACQLTPFKHLAAKHIIFSVKHLNRFDFDNNINQKKTQM